MSNRWVHLSLPLFFALLVPACGDETPPPEEEKPSALLPVPEGYPLPKIPKDNPLTQEKVELGRHLFYDKRLSGNLTQSCGTCHEQAKAFTDGRARALGSTMEVHPRSSMSIVNVAYYSTLTWANPTTTELEKQALVPMFGEFPVELGLSGKEEELLSRLSDDATYVDLFAKAFPDEEEQISLDTITKAIASFERVIVSYRTPFDRYTYGKETSAMSASALRGYDLFFSEKLECFHCHGTFNFSDSITYEGKQLTEKMFHNTGLYNIGGTGAYPESNTGILESTGIPEDMGRFRAPSLRNITLTAPYMHDGSIATLSEVLDHYAAGGRTITSGPDAGIGSKNPYKSELINGFELTEAERADVIAFLESLTDDALIKDPRFADPFQ